MGLSTCIHTHARTLRRRDLTTQLPLDGDELLYVRVRPERVDGGSGDGRERFARVAAVAVELFEESLCARDGRLGDREVAPSDDAL